MTGRYYLVRSYSGTNTGSQTHSDFYQRNTANPNFTNAFESQFPIIENCVKLEFSYLSANYTYSAGNFTETLKPLSSTWDANTFENPSFATRNATASYEKLVGVLVSVWVLDSRAAEKFSDKSADDLTNRAVRMRRFIPLNQH